MRPDHRSCFHISSSEDEEMPYVEITTREELPDAVRAKLAETLLVTMMNIEIGHPTDAARAIGWVWFHTLPGTSWSVGGRFDDTYIKGRKMGFARIIAPEGILNSELKSKALAEVTKNLRDAMGAEDDSDASGIFAIYDEVPLGHWANGGKILLLSELLEEMGGEVSDARKREMKALVDGQTALKEHFRIPG
jgi:phenylpyruvate tautomerase PptA (4-oxalocrotonate tautomerase family)